MTRDTARLRRMLYRRHTHRASRPCDCQRLQPGPPRGLTAPTSDHVRKRGSVSAHFLAFDLGAESGRAILGRLRGGVLDIREVYRFPNEPVRQNGSLQWDILRLWLEMQRGARARWPARRLESVGVDTWGCDYALLGERGNLLENPYHYRDARTDGVMEAVFERVGAPTRSTRVTGIQFLPFNTLYQLYAACQRDAAADRRRATRFVTIPDLLNYWLTGALRAEYTNATTTQFVDARTRTWATGLLDGARPADAAAAAAGRAGHGARRAAARRVRRRCAGTPVVAPACHDTGSAVAVGRRPAAPRVPELGHLVAARHRARRADHHAARARAELHQRRRRLRHDAAAEEHRRAVAAAGLPAHAGPRDGQQLRLRRAAGRGRRASGRAFRSLFDPDHRGVPAPAPTWSTAIADYCRADRPAGAGGPGRLRARDPREPRLQVPRRARVARGAHRHAASRRSGSSAAARATGC